MKSKLLMLCCLGAWLPFRLDAQPRPPKRATLCSAVLPGLGQVYNHQSWKVPLLYAGFGGMVYFARHYQTDYRRFFSHALRAWNSPGQSTVVPGYGTGLVPYSNLERATLASRRYRDLNYLGIALLWGLNVVDANVSAHLRTFDESENLTIRLTPSLLLPAVGPVRVLAGIRLAVELTTVQGRKSENLP